MNHLERVRALREDREWTQEYVAKQLNVVQKTQSDYEPGKTRIPLDSVLLLARLYNVDMNDLCGLTDEPKPFPGKPSKEPKRE